MIASGSWDNTVRIWDIDTGKMLLKLDGFKTYFNCVYFSPDGRRLASGSQDSIVRLWDAETGKELI